MCILLCFPLCKSVFFRYHVLFISKCLFLTCNYLFEALFWTTSLVPFQAGLQEKWYQDTLAEAKKESRRKWREKRREEEAEGTETKGEERESGPAPLTLSHLQGFFLLFSLGLLLAGIAFLLEILHCYIHTKTPPSPPSLHASSPLPCIPFVHRSPPFKSN